MRERASRGVEGEDMKAGASGGAGTRAVERVQARRGQKGEPGMAGTKREMAEEGLWRVLEERIVRERPEGEVETSWRRRVWGPPQERGEGARRLDCLRSEKKPTRRAAMGTKAGEPRERRKETVRRRRDGVMGGGGDGMWFAILSPPLRILFINGEEKTEVSPPMSRTQVRAPERMLLTEAGVEEERREARNWARSYGSGARGSASWASMKAM